MKWRYNELTRAVTEMELGVGRALLSAFGGKTPEALPEYEELTSKATKKDKLPNWMRQFEEANPGRAIQTG